MSIYRRKSGRYAVLVDLDPTATGLRQRKSIGTYRTRKEAERAERQAIEARDRGIDLSPKTVTISELLDRYIAGREALERGAKTVHEYRGCADRLIRPHIGGVALSKLRPARIAEWVAMLRKRGGKPTKDKDGTLYERPLSAKSVYHAFALLNGAMRFAVRMELVGRNACDAVTRPSVRRSDVKALAPDEISRVLDMARGSRWEAFVTLLLATGARRGEMIAADWDDVDIEAGTFTVRASMTETWGKVGDESVHIVERKGTKTDRVRVIPLAPFAIDAFRSQRKMQLEDRLRAGALYEISAAIFTDELGRRYRPMQANDAYRTIATKATVATGLHALRHTSVTLLLASGADIRTVAGLAGHSTPTMTLSVYGHLVEGTARAACERLGTILTKLVVER